METNKERGTVLEVLMVVQYPDSTIKTGRLSGKGVKSIIFDPEAVISHIGVTSAAMKQWNTGDWRNNPTVLVEAKANRTTSCGWYCKSTACTKSVTVEDLEPVEHDEDSSRATTIRTQIAKLEEELALIEKS